MRQRFLRRACGWSAASLLAFGAPAAAQRGAQPPMLACGAHDGVDVICGTEGPEDLELAPDGRRIIVSQFSMSGTGSGLTVFDPASDTFGPLAIRSDRLDGWGDSSCPGPMTEALESHGISLGTHPDGVHALYVVNHGGRETIEMFELGESGDGWELIWHGCSPGTTDYNDVAILDGGDFLATRPTALQEAGGPGGGVGGGQVSGNVARWDPQDGETILADSEASYPNGIVVDPDGRYAYIAAWTGRQVRKYDLTTGETVDVAELDFMPDNLTWSADGQLVAAGINGFGGQSGFSVARLDPGSMSAETLYQPDAGAAPITGVSVALEVDGALYIGAFQGDRLVRVTR